MTASATTQFFRTEVFLDASRDAGFTALFAGVSRSSGLPRVGLGSKGEHEARVSGRKIPVPGQLGEGAGLRTELSRPTVCL